MSTVAELELWPKPSPPPSSISPSRLPGSTYESTKALLEVLKLNHERWHVFYDDNGRHNHISHHVLAVWAMGAHKDIISMGYKKNEHMMKPRRSSPEPITQENFNDHLGDHSYYDAYLRFFTEELRSKGPSSTLEEYIFSPKVNFGTISKHGDHPSMLSRFVAALMHALIHVGYGAEFGLPGMFVQGLAMAAGSRSGSNQILPPALFRDIDLLRENSRYVGLKSLQSTANASYGNGNDGQGPNSFMDVFSSNEVPNQPAPTSTPSLNLAAPRLAAVVSALSGGADPRTNVTAKNVHAFDVIARIINDPNVRPQKTGLQMIYGSVLEECGDAIYRYASEWSPDVSSVSAKIEELQWTAALLYAVSGFRQLEGGEFNADFLAMHFVTSALFLPSLAVYLSVPSQILLLRSHFVVCLTWWVAIGKAHLDIPAFFAADTAHPGPSGTRPTVNKRALPAPQSPIAINPNPWTYIIQQAITHPDDHVPKLLRALMHFSVLYGEREAGFFGGTELRDADKIDGTLFIRAAGLTVERLTREFREVPDEQVYWDRKTYIPGAPHGSY
ncbi:hypothetical protein E1B28_013780 [Marasmius oreades]|uniref:Uncharacterized protein n=1 Tax=Marasmius oreades TaxID=181124 RepID=A0A9P7UMM5_9AGAR|nr:uncharacterized protein E1B28_013780 [Marasmius oreades]KAG7087842.1 hypothetical protein E1B28_013780 [Marasmius oreades]